MPVDPGCFKIDFGSIHYAGKETGMAFGGLSQQTSSHELAGSHSLAYCSVSIILAFSRLHGLSRFLNSSRLPAA